MNLEGDALDTLTWISSGRTIRYWDELVQVLQEQFGPAEFQNPDVRLCDIKQVGSVSEYKQEFVRRQSRVQGWLEHCLLGVFIHGLKEELQVDVKIQKPRTVYKAVSLTLEFEAKLQDYFEERDAVLTTIWGNLTAAQSRMQKYADLHRRDVEFQPSDMVFLRIQPYKQHSLAKHRFEKLAPRFYGPYTVLRHIGAAAYEFQLPREARIHPIFHVSLLKPAYGNTSSSLSPLPITDDWEALLEPESIISSRLSDSVSDSTGHKEVQLLVKWKGRPTEEVKSAAGRPMTLLQLSFPLFALRTRLFSKGGVMIGCHILSWFTLGR